MSIATPSAIGSSSAVGSGPATQDLLRARLRRQRRISQLRSLALIAPLFLFLLTVFILPIALLLTRSVDNREVASTLPQTVAVLQAWPGNTELPESAYIALATDLREATPEQVAELAKRLNYYESGLRSLLQKTGRRIENAAAETAAAQTPADWRAQLVAIDGKWGDPDTWQILKRAAPRYTDFYLLTSLDLQRSADGGIEHAGGGDAIFREILWRTFSVSVVVTLLCLALGYPLAYFIATASHDITKICLVFVLLPFWTSLLVRTTAWVVLLQGRGVVNTALAWLGLIDRNHPLELVHNRIGVLIAMTHILLPFMVLPILSVMKSIAPSYMRAASSLGAPPFKAFLQVYMPLSMPGISAGCLLVFILALGYYITPALVGGPRDQMLSYFIAYFANQVTNWGMAAALSAILLVLVLVLYGIYNRLVGIDRLRIG